MAENNLTLIAARLPALSLAPSLPRVLALSLVLALLFVVPSGFCLRIPDNLSVMVLTFDIPERSGTYLARDFRRVLEEGLAASSTPSLGEFLQEKGAKWSVLETASTLQLGLFLPLSSSEAEEVTSVFLKHLSIRLFDARFATPSPNLADQLRRYCHARLAPPSESKPRVSLWLQGGLLNAHKKLGEIVATMNLPVPGPDEPPLSPDLVISNEGPRVIHLAIWDKPSADAIVTAKFLGERFIRLPTANRAFSYDIWTFPEGVVLTLAATAPMEHLWEKDGIIADFVDRQQETASSPQWSAFSAQSGRLHDGETRDLEKGSFLEAWCRHQGIPDFGKSIFSFLPPDRKERVVCLPKPFMHRVAARLDANPRCAAMLNPDLGDSVSLVVAMRGDPGLLAKLGSKISSAALPELSGSTWETTSDRLLLWSWTTPQNGVSYSLSSARFFLESALKAEGALGPVTDPFAGLQLAVVGAGALKSFNLYGLIQQGWPGLAASLPKVRALDLDSLRILLDLPGAPPAALKGRWTLKTAMPGGLTQVLARLLMMDISPSALEEVAHLF